MTQGPVEELERRLECAAQSHFSAAEAGMVARDAIALCRSLQQQLAQRDEELSQVILEAGECEPLVSMRGDGSEPMIDGVPVYLRGDPNLRDKLLQMFKACNDWHDEAHERMAEVQQQLAAKSAEAARMRSACELVVKEHRDTQQISVKSGCDVMIAASPGTTACIDVITTAEGGKE